MIEKRQFKLGAKAYAVQGTIEGEHNIGNRVGVKTKLEGTLGSIGAETGVGPGYRAKFGIHFGVGWSVELELYDPKK